MKRLSNLAGNGEQLFMQEYPAPEALSTDILTCFTGRSATTMFR
jgi:hypothetical protein